jgi:hypothetical protein
MNRTKQLAFVHLTLVKLYILYLGCRNRTLPQVSRFFHEQFEHGFTAELARTPSHLRLHDYKQLYS